MIIQSPQGQGYVMDIAWNPVVPDLLSVVYSTHKLYFFKVTGASVTLSQVPLQRKSLSHELSGVYIQMKSVAHQMFHPVIFGWEYEIGHRTTLALPVYINNFIVA